MELSGSLWEYHLRRDEAGVSPFDHREAEWVKISGHMTGKGLLRPIHDVSALLHHWVSYVDTFPRSFLRRSQYKASKKRADPCFLTSNLCSTSRKIQQPEHCRG